MNTQLKRAGLALAIALLSAGAMAEPLTLAIKSRQFEPAELQLPPGKKVQLVVHNQDAIPAEFESYDLSREVIIPPGGKAKVYIGPLEPGNYQFFDDFNPAAKGQIVVKAGNAGKQ